MKSIGNKKPLNILTDTGAFNVITKEVNNMSSLALSFNEVNFEATTYQNEVWLGSTQIGLALQYANPETAITKLYNRNSEEFTNSMTRLIETKTNGGIQKVRVFSLRGCHLLAMFARTVIAKQFRKWVLDILDREVGQPIAKTHKSEREPLTNAVNMLIAKTKHLNFSEAYKLVHQRFNVDHIEDIPYEAIPVAVEYVHHLIALYSSAGKQSGLFDQDTYELIRQLTEAVILENDEIVPVLMAVKIIDEKKFAYYAHKVVKANESAQKVSRILDFRNNLNEPLIDVNCKVISLSTGQRFMARPNWFNCPS